MSAKGTLPEADSLRVPPLSSRAAKLAQLFVEWTSQHPVKIIVAFVILTFVALMREAGFLTVFVGVETPEPKVLTGIDKAHNASLPMLEAIETLTVTDSR